ncbi:MAG: sporulation integral membrane protein YtvI [Lachnospiraceae bacterium]|nr:sporulation integral membrane protein YtvI [Lachnospiraceae bacterium]
MNRHVKQYLKVSINIIVAILILIGVIYYLPKLLVFFMPFLIGWIIALIANKPVKFFEEKLRIKRKAGSVIIIVLVLAAVVSVLYFILLVLIKQVIGFITDLPDMWAGLKNDIESITTQWQGIYAKLPKGVREFMSNMTSNLSQVGGTLINKISSPTIDAIGSFALSLPGLLISLIMCILSAYFFVAEKEYLQNAFEKYVPKKLQHRWQLITDSLKHSVGSYFSAQFKIEFWIYLILLVGLFILGVRYSPLVALGIAFLDLLPFFGSGTIMVPWAIIKLCGGDIQMAIGLLIIWGISQVVRQFIQPKIMGDSIGLKPIPTLFLLFIGYKVAGVIGMIVALPIGIIVLNLNEAGVFDTTKNSLKLLAKKVNDFRQLDKYDLEYIGKKETEQSEQDKYE